MRPPSPPPPPVVPRRVGAASPIHLDDDDALEACDEPVPLSEPGKANRGGAAAAQDDDDDSVLIPENLQLLPKTNAGGARPPK